MNDYVVREIKEDEIRLLEDFLYECIFQRPENEPLPRDVINSPEISIYIKDFGKKDDHCLVAEKDGQIIGAVWVRILSGEVKGFGNIDEKTPEFAISLLPKYRGQGIGTGMMEKMIQLLKVKGYSKASLSVDKNNYALKLYEKMGFRIIEKREKDYIMLLEI